MRIRTFIAFGAGYLLGAKAGRERYALLTNWFERIADSSTAQAFGDRSRDLMGSSLNSARNAAAGGLTAASDQVRKIGG